MEENKKTKKTTILLRIGVPILVIGIILLVVSVTSMFNGESNLFFLGFVAMPLIFIGLVLTKIGASPYLGKLNAEIRKETLDHAGKEISESYKVGAKVVSPAIKEIAKEIKSTDSIESKLEEIKSLYNKGIITREEYEKIRKNILGI